jgi:hypothetical protein
VRTAPRSSSPYLADLLDLDVTAVDDDYSPPEPCIPPPAPPSFLLASSLNAAAATLTSSSPPPSLELGVCPDVRSAVALFDYQSSHPGDLNFKVHNIQIPRVCTHPETWGVSNESHPCPPRDHKLSETIERFSAWALGSLLHWWRPSPRPRFIILHPRELLILWHLRHANREREREYWWDLFSF